MKKAKLMQVKTEESPESPITRRLKIQWRSDGTAQVESDPPCSGYEILGLLVNLVRQLGG